MEDTQNVVAASTYDRFGNQLTATDALDDTTTTHTYGSSNTLLTGVSYSSGAIPSTYDWHGNQTARGSDTFSWDAENRLTSATAGGQSETNSYNGDGLRQSRTPAGSTKSFVYDVSGKLPLLLDDGSQYVYGLGLVSRVVGTSTSSYLADGLGSVLAIVDSSGTLQQSDAYDVFGAVTSQSGSLAPSSSSPASRPIRTACSTSAPASMTRTQAVREPLRSSMASNSAPGSDR